MHVISRIMRELLVCRHDRKWQCRALSGTVGTVYGPDSWSNVRIGKRR
jgi:hypothetical protein